MRAWRLLSCFIPLEAQVEACPGLDRVGAGADGEIVLVEVGCAVKDLAELHAEAEVVAEEILLEAYVVVGAEAYLWRKAEAAAGGGLELDSACAAAAEDLETKYLRAVGDVADAVLVDL